MMHPVKRVCLRGHMAQMVAHQSHIQGLGQASCFQSTLHTTPSLLSFAEAAGATIAFLVRCTLSQPCHVSEHRMTCLLEIFSCRLPCRPLVWIFDAQL